MDIASVRNGLRDRLATIVDLYVHDTVPGTVQPPAAVVVPAGGTFDATFGRGSDDLVFEIRMATAQGWTPAGQDQLDQYLAGSGAKSVKAAVEADLTLGGACHFAVVSGWEGYGEVEIGGVNYFGTTFTVEVTGAGT